MQQIDFNILQYIQGLIRTHEYWYIRQTTNKYSWSLLQTCWFDALLFTAVELSYTNLFCENEVKVSFTSLNVFIQKAIDAHISLFSPRVSQ